jgi:hypothetical protein
MIDAHILPEKIEDPRTKSGWAVESPSFEGDYLAAFSEWLSAVQFAPDLGPGPRRLNARMSVRVQALPPWGARPPHHPPEAPSNASWFPVPGRDFSLLSSGPRLGENPSGA